MKSHASFAPRLRQLSGAVVALFALTLAIPLTAQDSERESEPMMDITPTEVRQQLANYRDVEKDPAQLADPIRALERLELRIFSSKTLEKHEKSRLQRVVDRRLRQLKKEQQVFLEQEDSDQERLQQSPNNSVPSSSQSTRHGRPLGWYRNSSWNGGGRLPNGGSWQGSQYSESWGQSWSSGDQQSANPQDQTTQGSRGQSASPGNQNSSAEFPILNWPLGWPTQLNGPSPLNLGPNGSQSNGSSMGASTGIRTGASSSSSKSSGSRTSNSVIRRSR